MKWEEGKESSFNVYITKIVSSGENEWVKNKEMGKYKIKTYFS